MFLPRLLQTEGIVSGTLADRHLLYATVMGQSVRLTNQRKTIMLKETRQELHAEIGIPADYAANGNLPEYAEAEDLIDIGPNLVGRMQRLTPAAAENWQQMVKAAIGDGIHLLIVSGFRSYQYQAALIRGKLNSGQSIEDVLKVSTAPGYSQHHSGKAIDIATPGSRPLSEEFEASEAFHWLTENARQFGFSMTYPRNHPSGIIYEPWHWSL